MAEELLDRSQRDAARREARGERVPEVVEADATHACRDAGRLESLGCLGPIQRSAELRVREHEVVVVAEGGPESPLLQFAHEAVAHRHGPTCAQVRLALAGVLASDPRVAHAYAQSAHIDVPPAQARAAPTGAGPSTPAARITIRSTGPSTARPTGSSGSVAITASSSASVRNCRSGFASPCSAPLRPRRPRYRVSDRPSLLDCELEDAVEERHRCCGPSWARGLGRAGIATSRSMSARRTLSTRRLPSAGEMCDPLHGFAVLAGTSGARPPSRAASRRIVRRHRRR